MKILGCQDFPAQCHFPRKKTGSPTQIGTLNMEKYNICKIIDVIDDIINISISDDCRKEKWKTSVRHYRKTIQICRKDGNYMQEELQTFDEKIKDFFQI